MIIPGDIVDFVFHHWASWDKLHREKLNDFLRTRFSLSTYLILPSRQGLALFWGFLFPSRIKRFLAR